MKNVIDKIKVYDVGHYPYTKERVRQKALILEGDELAYIIKLLRRGSVKDKQFARKMFKCLTGFDHCPECGKLTRQCEYSENNRKRWQCKNCHEKTWENKFK